MTDLLACPFCGGEAQRFDIEGDITDDNFGGSGIECRSCHATTAIHFDRKENLFSSWNERVSLPDRERIADTIREKKQGFDIPQDLALEMADAILALSTKVLRT